jgi:hypothetical protein
LTIRSAVQHSSFRFTARCGFAVRRVTALEIARQQQQGPVAQLVSAPPCHGGGRGFESRQGRNIGTEVPTLRWHCFTGAARPGSSVGTSVRLKSGRSPVRSRPWPPRCWIDKHDESPFRSAGRGFFVCTSYCRRVDVIDRAQEDLARGDSIAARDRLVGALVRNPTSPGIPTTIPRRPLRSPPWKSSTDRP